MALNPTAPILIVPYVWIGDFVRVHSVVRLLREQAPDRPVDMVSSTLCAPLADYMPGLRRAIVVNMPRRGWACPAARTGRHICLRPSTDGQALVMSRKWRRRWRLARRHPGPHRFAGEARFGLLNDMRWAQRAPSMIDQMGALLCRRARPRRWPLPNCAVPPTRSRNGATNANLGAEAGPIVTLRPARSAPAKPGQSHTRRTGARAREGRRIGSGRRRPGRKSAAKQIVRCRPRSARSHRQRSAQRHPRARRSRCVGHQRSGLMHISAAYRHADRRDFGPTSPWHWKPLNPVAAILNRLATKPPLARARRGNRRSRPSAPIDVPWAASQPCRRAGRTKTHLITTSYAVNVCSGEPDEPPIPCYQIFK